MRVMWLGTYEREYPRSRVLVAGLRELGVEVVEHHRPVWERSRHKAGAFLAPLPLAASGARFAASWAGLAREGLRERPVDAVVAGYLAQPDALPAWCVARARRVPLVADMMISLADTLGGRPRPGRPRRGARRWRASTASPCGSPTWSSPTRAPAPTGWPRRFGVPRSRIAVVPVGAEPDRFPVVPPPAGAAARRSSTASSRPLHGVATVLEAARAPGAPPVRLIGDGQLGPLARGRAGPRPPAGPHLGALGALRGAGRGGGGRRDLPRGLRRRATKAARVVPNKVWQAMAAGRPVVTADTPGVREVLSDGVDALLVPPADPAALAAALARLAADPALRARLGAAAHADLSGAAARPPPPRPRCATRSPP